MSEKSRFDFDSVFGGDMGGASGKADPLGIPVGAESLDLPGGVPAFRVKATEEELRKQGIEPVTPAQALQNMATFFGKLPKGDGPKDLEAFRDALVNLTDKERKQIIYELDACTGGCKSLQAAVFVAGLMRGLSDEK